MRAVRAACAAQDRSLANADADAQSGETSHGVECGDEGGEVGARRYLADPVHREDLDHPAASRAAWTMASVAFSSLIQSGVGWTATPSTVVPASVGSTSQASRMPPADRAP